MEFSPVPLASPSWADLAPTLVALLAVLAPAAYLLLVGTELREAVRAARQRHPCGTRFAKAAAYAVLLANLVLPAA